MPVSDGRGDLFELEKDLMVLQRRDGGIELGDGTLELFFRRRVIQVLVAFGKLAREVAQIVAPLRLAEHRRTRPGLGLEELETQNGNEDEQNGPQSCGSHVRIGRDAAR